MIVDPDNPDGIGFDDDPADRGELVVSPLDFCRVEARAALGVRRRHETAVPVGPGTELDEAEVVPAAGEVDVIPDLIVHEGVVEPGPAHAAGRFRARRKPAKATSMASRCSGVIGGRWATTRAT